MMLRAPSLSKSRRRGVAYQAGEGSRYSKVGSDSPKIVRLARKSARKGDNRLEDAISRCANQMLEDGLARTCENEAPGTR